MSALVSCDICYDDLPPSDIVRTCRSHSFCRFCVKLGAVTNLGSSEDAKCPAADCGVVLGPSVLFEVGGEQMVLRDRQMQQVRKQRRNPLSRWCPKCNEHTLKASGTSRKAVCLLKTCGFEFCSECLGRHHPFRPCLGLGPTSLGVWTAFHDAKSCPQCHVMIHKQGGCPHMTCATCKFNFCWGCRRPLSGKGSCPSGVLCNEVTHHWIWGPNIGVRTVTKTVGLAVAAPFMAAAAAAAVVVFPVLQLHKLHQDRLRKKVARRNSGARWIPRGRWERENRIRMRDAQRREAAAAKLRVALAQV